MPKLFKRPTSLIDHAATRSSHTMATSSWAVLVAAMGLMATMSFAAPDVPGANLPESSFLLKGMEANTGPALRAIESWELGGSASIVNIKQRETWAVARLTPDEQVRS